MKVTEKPDGTVTVETGQAAVAKADHVDTSQVATMVIKAVPARRYTLAVVYPVRKADVAVALDGFRDFASAEAVEKAAWDFMKSRNVGLRHADGTDGAAEVVESYIWPGPDWVVKGTGGAEHTIVAGDWLAGFVWSESAWPDVEARRLNGVSPQGKAQRRTPSAQALEGLRS